MSRIDQPLIVRPPAGDAWRNQARAHGAALAVIAALSVAAFWPTLQNGFLPLGFDDGLILDTPAIRALMWENLRSLLTEFNRVNYIPVTMISFAVHYSVWGLDPFGYHLSNVLLHTVTAMLVFVFLSRIAPAAGAALLATLLFALHPVHVQTVSLAVERKTLLSGAFCLLTLVAYQRWKDSGRRWYYTASVLAFVVAALSKAMAVSLPPVLLLYDYAFVGGPVRWREKVPFFGLAVAVSYAAVAGHAHEGALIPPHGGTVFSHVLAVGRATLEYVTSLFVPLGLSPVYYYPRTTVYGPLNFLAVAVIVFVCAYVTVHRRRFGWSFFCLSWFVLMLLPESNVVPLAQLRADRYLYLPAVAFALWTAVGIERLPTSVAHGGRWHRPTHWLGFAAAAAFGVITFTSAGVWRDNVSAWTRVVERHPWCAVAHAMLGRAYYAQQDYAGAERAFRQALRFEIAPPEAHLYLGKVYAAHGLAEPAAMHLRRYVELAPTDPEGPRLLATLVPSGDS